MMKVYEKEYFCRLIRSYAWPGRPERDVAAGTTGAGRAECQWAAVSQPAATQAFASAFLFSVFRFVVLDLAQDILPPQRDRAVPVFQHFAVLIHKSGVGYG